MKQSVKLSTKNKGCRPSTNNAAGGMKWACICEFMSTCIVNMYRLIHYGANLEKTVKNSSGDRRKQTSAWFNNLSRRLGKPSLKSRLACLHITYRSEKIQSCLHVLQSLQYCSVDTSRNSATADMLILKLHLQKAKPGSLL